MDAPTSVSGPSGSTGPPDPDVVTDQHAEPSAAPASAPPAPSPPVGAVGPAPRAVPGRGPALVVLGIAVGIVVLGGVGSALSSSPAPAPTARTVRLADGVRLPVVPATAALRRIEFAGQPPADVLGNLALPAGGTVTGTVDDDGGQGTYDRTADLSTHRSSAQVVAGYRAIFATDAWTVLYDGGATRGPAGATELLAKHASGDGYFWEAGVVVPPTSSGTTRYTLELFEISDDN